jgi:hypothetical protein
MWETIKDTLAQLFYRVGVLLILLGVILFILGAAGGVGYNAVLAIKDPLAQYALEIVGSILLAIGIFVSVRIPASEPDGAKIGVKIISPRENERVGVVNVIGEIEKKVPNGYTLMLLRVYPDAGHAVYPWAEVRLNPDNKRWTVVDCDIGGRKGDRRILAVYLVGESGKALIRYFREASRVHNATNEKLRKFPDE